MPLRFVNFVYISICLPFPPPKWFATFHKIPQNFHIHSRLGNCLSIGKRDGIGNNTIRLKYINEKLRLLLRVCPMLKRLERLKRKKGKISKAIEERTSTESSGKRRCKNLFPNNFAFGWHIEWTFSRVLIALDRASRWIKTSRWIST